MKDVNRIMENELQAYIMKVDAPRKMEMSNTVTLPILLTQCQYEWNSKPCN